MKIVINSLQKFLIREERTGLEPNLIVRHSSHVGGSLFMSINKAALKSGLDQKYTRFRLKCSEKIDQN